MTGKSHASIHDYAPTAGFSLLWRRGEHLLGEHLLGARPGRKPGGSRCL